MDQQRIEKLEDDIPESLGLKVGRVRVLPVKESVIKATKVLKWATQSFLECLNIQDGIQTGIMQLCAKS